MDPDHIFILTGAGISADSGVETFRSAGGIWEKVDLMEVATPEGFAQNPVKVQEFYNARRRGLPIVQPNAAHGAVARLQTAWAERGKRVFLCTQNVDDLHERGGATQVHHMHGALLNTLCNACGAVSAQAGDLAVTDACPACSAVGVLRPDVVWFGEMPYGLELIAAELERADLFVAIGTSGAVYPAAGFVAEARARGIATLELNLEPSETRSFFGAARYGRASEITPAWVEELIRAAAA